MRTFGLLIIQYSEKQTQLKNIWFWELFLNPIQFLLINTCHYIVDLSISNYLLIAKIFLRVKIFTFEIKIRRTKRIMSQKGGKKCLQNVKDLSDRHLVLFTVQCTQIGTVWKWTIFHLQRVHFWRWVFVYELQALE